MRLLFGFVLLIGIGLAGGAVYMARDYIGQQQAQLAEAERAKQAIIPTVTVFVANKQLRYGQRLTAEDVDLVRWPEESLPEGAFTTPEELFPDGREVTRAVLRALEPSEPILAVKVTAPGHDAGVSSRLSPGMRAFTIRTDVTAGVSGFLRPGDRVDIYWTGQGITKLIDTSVDIIAINQSADEDSDGPVVARTVTVEVNPRQVAALAQAQATGRLSLSLVGADDTLVSGQVEIDQRDLLGIEDEVVVEAPKEKVCTVRRRSGEEIIEVPIPCTN